MSHVTAAEAAAPVRSRAARVSLRVLTVVLALFFALASALPKLIAHSTAVETFDTIGWGSAGMYAVGVLELAGAIGLLVPVLAGVTPIALCGLLVGAFITQLTVFDGENAATPLILMVPLAVLAWTNRSRNRELLALLRRTAG
ncbi:DoxX family protein [Streptomyces longispororuber]|uniref:DoxX family protein n=1 Tax=Streptomyces longispororuber TaxID=68230 RepID=UPI00210D54D0|nr:DoxX family protein [Streptomyces longispororuber]MCQ4213471.1 DoxX family protein [Streptomyces longispororuber]